MTVFCAVNTLCFFLSSIRDCYLLIVCVFLGVEYGETTPNSLFFFFLGVGERW